MNLLLHNVTASVRRRKVAEKNAFTKENTRDSISPVKILMSNIFTRLKLKEKGVECPAATS